MSLSTNKSAKKKSNEHAIKADHGEYLAQMNELIHNSSSRPQSDNINAMDEIMSILYLNQEYSESISSSWSDNQTTSETVITTHSGNMPMAGNITHRSEFYSAIIEHARDAIAITEESSVITYANPAITHLTGFSRSELKNKNLLELVHSDDRDTLSRLYKKPEAREELPEFIEFRLKHKEGGWIEVESSVADMLNDPLVAGIILYLRDNTIRKQTEAKLKQSIKTNKILASRRRTEKEKERHCIARELHDDLGQSLSLLNMDIQMLDHKLQSNLGNKRRKEFNNDFENLNRSVQDTLDRVHRIIYNLRPPILDKFGLDEAISWVANKYHGDELKVYYTSGLDCHVDEPLKTHAFRIVQESLTNIFKHAHANKVIIKTMVSDSMLFITVSDNGVGMPKDHLEGVNSLGLQGMKERASDMDGTLTIESARRKGTTITLSAPMPAAKE